MDCGMLFLRQEGALSSENTHCGPLMKHRHFCYFILVRKFIIRSRRGRTEKVAADRVLLRLCLFHKPTNSPSDCSTSDQLLIT